MNLILSLQERRLICQKQQSKTQETPLALSPPDPVCPGISSPGSATVARHKEDSGGTAAFK